MPLLLAAIVVGFALTSAPGLLDLEDVLIKLELVEYKDALLNDGWEDLSFLSMATADDLAASGLSATEAVK
eukprot:SAG31_NODE_1439_length_8332_cov_11.389166_3_plen_71_part_00